MKNDNNYSILLNIPIRKGIYLYTFSILKKKSSLFNITFKFLKTNLYPDKVFCRDCKYYKYSCYHSSNLIIKERCFFKRRFEFNERYYDINCYNNCNNFEKGEFLYNLKSFKYCSECKFYKNKNCYHKLNRKNVLVSAEKPIFGKVFISTPYIINGNNDCENFKKHSFIRLIFIRLIFIRLIFIRLIFIIFIGGLFILIFILADKYFSLIADRLP